jgi:hypothetical protein
MVERQLPKLDTRVRFPSPAPIFLFASVGFTCSLVRAADWEIELLAGSVQYQAREVATNQLVLNKETGGLPLRGFALTKQFAGFKLGLEYSLASGNVDYAGFTQSFLPIRTQSAMAMSDLRLALKVPVWSAERQSIYMQMTLGQQKIDRDILPGPLNSRLREVLSSDRVGLGLGYALQYELAQDLKLKVETSWNIDRSYSNRLSIDAFNLFDPTYVTPRAYSRQQLAAAARLIWPSGLAIGLNIVLSEFSPGSSGDSPIFKGGSQIGLVSYPGSRQRALFGLLSLTYSF